MSQNFGALEDIMFMVRIHHVTKDFLNVGGNVPSGGGKKESSELTGEFMM